MFLFLFFYTSKNKPLPLTGVIFFHILPILSVASLYLAGHKPHNQTSLGWNWASTVGSLYGIKPLMIQYPLGEEEEEDEKRRGEGVEEQMERRRK